MLSNKNSLMPTTRLDGLPAASPLNLLDDYDANGDSALLGTRQEVQENFYSDSKVSCNIKSTRLEL
jgi:hypothetical protein